MTASPTDPTAAVTQDEAMTLGSNNNSANMFPAVEGQSSQGIPGAGQTGQNFLNEDFLQVLDEHRKNCEREGRVQEAQHTRKRLKQLRI